MIAPELDARLRTAAAEAMPQAVAELTRLVAIPSISWPAFGQEPMAASAEAIRELAAQVGVFGEVAVRTARIPGTAEDGQPAVLATRDAAGRRVLLYAHHDVQPVGDETAWRTPPFVATPIGGRLYGRGTADDKAGVLTHLTALKVVKEVLGDGFDLGVTLFVEGEEEYGSRSFSQFLHDHHDALAADLIVVADSGNWDSETPGLTVSLRGNARFTLRVRTLTHALHSGMFGGAVPDAMLATIKLLNTLWDENGEVAVPGLLTRVAEVPDYAEARLREETDLLETSTTIGSGPLLDRIWNRPAITVIGIDHVSVAAASNALSPEVGVVISARVAPGQDAAQAYRAIRAHLEANAPFGAQLEFSDVDCGQGFEASTSWATELGLTALEQGYGVRPVELGVGGSIPFISDLAAEFPQAGILVTAVLDPMAAPHSPNESLHLATFEHAILAEALLLAALATQ